MMPRARQHHHERPDRVPGAGRRVGPGPSLPVVDLRLTARRPAPAAPSPRPGGVSSARFAATYRRTTTATPSAPLRAAAMIVDTVTPAFSCSTMYSRCASIAGHVTCRTRVSDNSGNHPHQLRPHRLTHRRPARHHPRGHRRGQVLAHRLAVHAQALRDLAPATDPPPSGPGSRSCRPRPTSSSPSAPPAPRSGLGGMLLLP